MKCFLKQISIVGMEVFLLFMLFNSGLCQDYITIFRREGFQEDTFTIPDKSCDRSRVSETCIGYGAVDAGDPAGCKCLCSAANVVGTPGFFYTNGKWRCISQKSIRASQGCHILMTPSESLNSELISLKPEETRPLNLIYTNAQANCAIDAAKSKYMLCDGSWMPLSKNETDRFQVVKPSPGKSSTIFIKVNSHIGGVNLDGRLVNLRFTEDCATNINSENLCLLFKLRGSFTCPIDLPTKPIQTTNMDNQSSQSSNSSIPSTPAKPNTTNQDVVFLICGGVALVAIIFIVIIIINLRRTERRNQRRAAPVVVAPGSPKFPPSHVVVVQKEVGVSTNGGFTDDTSSGLKNMTGSSTQTVSSGYHTDGNETKIEIPETSVKDYNTLVEEDSEEDPIYENICDKCKEMNLVGPCEHVVPYDSDNAPVYENVTEEGDGSDNEDGEKKSLDSPKSAGEEAELGKKEEEVCVVKEVPVSAASKDQTEEQKDGETAMETEDENQELKSRKKERDNSKQNGKRRKKRKQSSTSSQGKARKQSLVSNQGKTRKQSLASIQGKIRKQSSTEKADKQEKQNLVGNLEQEHSDEDDIGGEHVYDNVEDSTESDDDHIYESVCESSDDESGDEYYNIVELDKQITSKVKADDSSETIDTYRSSNPPPLPPRPSDESSQEGSPKESREDNGKKMQPKKPQRKLRRQTTKDESTDSETEDSPRIPPRLYDAEEENKSSLSTERENVPSLPERLYDEAEEKNTKLSTEKENTGKEENPSRPPRLYDEEEEHINTGKLTQQTNDTSEDVAKKVKNIDSDPSTSNVGAEANTAL